MVRTTGTTYGYTLCEELIDVAVLVIDCGFVKSRIMMPGTGVEMLKVRIVLTFW
jgi:hypothetical protein